MKKISGILNTKLAKVAEKLISRKSKVTQDEWSFRRLYYALMCAELFEHLLLFDEVAIAMNIDNAPLSILINEFGVNDTASLIETGAIKLIIRKIVLISSVGNIESGVSESDGIPPVLSGMLVDGDIFSDPIKCIDDAFNFVRYNYSKRERDIFTKRILPFIVIDDSNTGQKAVKLLIDAYHSNYLSTSGLPYVQHENSLNYSQRGQMLEMASEVTDLMLISSHNYGMYNQSPMYNIAKTGVGQLLNALHISNSMNEITSKAERMPDLQALYFTKKIGFYSLVKIRKNNNSKVFRNWINEKTKEDDAEYIISQYIDSITNQSGFFTTGKGKFIKSMMSFGIGLGVSGTAAALIPPTPATLPVAVSLGIATANKLNEHLSNEFLNGILGGLTSGWTPRQYITLVQKHITEN